MSNPTPSILIVEDDAPLRNALSIRLSREGYTVLQASNGQEGLEIALHQHPALILLDITMPIMTGTDMLASLRADAWGETVKVIILTNSDDTTNLATAVEKNVLGYVMKSTVSLGKIMEMAERYVPITTMEEGQ